jgi:hypothetical protein
MSEREGNLNDYLAASFVAFAIAMVIDFVSSAVRGNWGIFIAIVIVGGLFVYVAAGWTASYLNFRFHKMGTNTKMAGLSAGFFAALVFTVITLIMAIVGAIANTPGAANEFIGWILNAVFAFIFMSLGGYISGMFEESSWAMPAFFNFSKLPARVPPPPPGVGGATAQMCPTCGRPMRFVEQYNRWYCDFDKKYA